MTYGNRRGGRPRTAMDELDKLEEREYLDNLRELYKQRRDPSFIAGAYKEGRAWHRHPEYKKIKMSAVMELFEFAGPLRIARKMGLAGSPKSIRSQKKKIPEGSIEHKRLNELLNRKLEKKNNSLFKLLSQGWNENMRKRSTSGGTGGFSNAGTVRAKGAVGATPGNSPKHPRYYLWGDR